MTWVRWFLQVSPRWSYSFSLCNKLTCGEIFWVHVNVGSVFSLLCKASPGWEVRSTGSEGTLVEGALASFWSGDNTESHLYSANYVPSPVSALHMLTLISHISHMRWVLRLSDFVPGETEPQKLRLWQPLSGVLEFKPGGSHCTAGTPHCSVCLLCAVSMRHSWHRDLASLTSGLSVSPAWEVLQYHLVPTAPRLFGFSLRASLPSFF